MGEIPKGEKYLNKEQTKIPGVFDYSRNQARQESSRLKRANSLTSDVYRTEASRGPKEPLKRTNSLPSDMSRDLKASDGRTSTTSGESNPASDIPVNDAETPTATNGLRDEKNLPHVESSPTSEANGASSDRNTDMHRVPDKDPTSGSGDEHHLPHSENLNAANGSGDDRTLTSQTLRQGEGVVSSADQSHATTDFQKQLEWLALTKVSKELKDRGLFKYLGYGTTDTKIETKSLSLYEKNGIYYVICGDKNLLKDKYDLEDKNIVKPVDNDELFKKLWKDFDSIQWDLPKIHAIRTAERKEEWDGHNKVDTSNNTLVGDPKKLRPKVLITVSEDIVQQRIVNPETDDEKKGWKAALPWPSPVFEISSKNPTKEEKSIKKEKSLIYKALHGEISDKTKGKYKDTEKLLNSIDIDMMQTVKHKNNETSTYRDIIKSFEYDLVQYYYKSDSYIKKEFEKSFSEYGKCIERIQEKFKGNPEDKTLGAGIIEFLRGTHYTVDGMVKRRGIAYKSIKQKLSDLGFDQLKDGSKTKFDMRGDLYLISEVDGTIRLTNKQPDNNSTLVSTEQLDSALGDTKRLEEFLGKVKYDLKVYAIQRPDQDDSKDKKPEILVTDDRDLVARMRKRGWKTLPWTETGIELSQEDRQFYQNYKEFYQKCDEDIRKQLDRCNKGIDKIYWDRSGKYKRDELMEKIKELKIILSEKKDLSKNNIISLEDVIKDILEKDYLKKTNILPLLKKNVKAKLTENLANYDITVNIENFSDKRLKVFEHEGSLYLSYAQEKIKFKDERGQESSVTNKHFADYSDEDLACDKVQWRFVTTSVLLNKNDSEKPELLVTNSDDDAACLENQLGWKLLGRVENVDVRWKDIEEGSRHIVSSIKKLLDEWIENEEKVEKQDNL